MNRSHLAIVSFQQTASTSLSFAEQLADQAAILQGYLDTHLTRNHSQKTLQHERSFLTGWFEGFRMPDPTHPDGARQLFIWEAMEPAAGRQRIMAFSKGMVQADLKPRTIGTYLGSLRHLFDYVLAYPFIPGEPVQSIIAKYGPVHQPVLEYDYPTHILDQDQEGFVLTGDQLFEFYDFVLEKYVKHNQKKDFARRDYTMIVLAGESGLRAEEISYLDALPPHRDLFYQHNCIQTRYGKAAKGSGKRIRKTVFTEFAQATMQVYEAQVRPLFQGSQSDPALFLNQSGRRIAYSSMWRNLHVISEAALKAGLELPTPFSWHSLRKSFATNFMERYPHKVWVLMDMMGHLNLSTLHRYVKHTRDYYDQARDSLIEEMIR